LFGAAAFPVFYDKFSLIPASASASAFAQERSVMSPPRLLYLAIVSAFWSPTFAQSPEGISFQHEDWELVCDNTRTCRAVGYPEEGNDGTVSVMLTRKAGPGTIVTGRVRIGDDWEENAPAMPARFKLGFWIDGRAQGSVAMTNENRMADLTTAQVAALLKALLRDSSIEFRAGDGAWALSDRGASAVLLKMDEAQGRIGTVGALHRKGKQDESRVLPAVPAQVVRVAALHPALPGDAKFIDKHGTALRAALLKAVGEDGCMDLEEPQGETEALEIHRLTKNKLLVSTRCWLAAYNAGSGYWVIDDKLPFRPQLVTTSGTDYDAGKIGATHKGRGIGDCWGADEWVWDGARFAHTLSMSTGQCRGFLGGAWKLPSWVTEVRGR
jgi:hypothetical protein